MATTGSCGTGVDGLQKANHGILFDMPFVESVRKQALGRLWRYGQRFRCHWTELWEEGSLAEWLIKERHERAMATATTARRGGARADSDSRWQCGTRPWDDPGVMLFFSGPSVPDIWLTWWYGARPWDVPGMMLFFLGARQPRGAARLGHRDTTATDHSATSRHSRGRPRVCGLVDGLRDVEDAGSNVACKSLRLAVLGVA